MLGATFQQARAFATGPDALNSRAMASGGVVEAKRPHIPRSSANFYRIVNRAA
jgi:hypothetical protein